MENTALIVPPLANVHKQTFIILHGRGSSAQKFAPSLLSAEFTLPLNLPKQHDEHLEPSSPSSSQKHGQNVTLKLQTAFPHAKFIFPTAPRTRATLYKRAKTNQWFDSWDVSSPPATGREELQAPGLKETVTYLHGLMEKEIVEVPGGAKNVVLWGISQGCAASLMATLLWETGRLGGVVGMCGWLPYADKLKGELSEQPAGEVGDDNDIFERSGGEEDKPEQHTDPAKRAINWLREELELQPHQGKARKDVELVFKKSPLFLGHGIDDDKVSVALGRTAFSCLRDLGMERVEWKEYEDLGHWYSGEMLSDVVGWIGRETGCDIC